MALWSLVLGALLPVLSHAAIRSQNLDAGWVEVCTTTGMAWVKAGDTPTQPDDGSETAAMAQCHWCSTHATGMAFPPAATDSVVLPVPTAALPAAFFHAPYRLAVWLPSQSRAPPVPA